MEKKDLELEQRVWQRVAGAAPESDRLEELVQRQEEAAAAYRYLAMNTGGGKREKLTALHRQALHSAAVLRGMVILNCSQTHKREAYTPAKEGFAHLLARVCRSACRMQQELSALAEHAEYGCVFRDLAQQECAAVQTLLALIGD